MVNDKEIFNLIEKEKHRQKFGIELIASENFVSNEVMKAAGSCLTNFNFQHLSDRAHL